MLCVWMESFCFRDGGKKTERDRKAIRYGVESFGDAAMGGTRHITKQYTSFGGQEFS